MKRTIDAATRKKLIETALKKRKADLVLKNARVFNTFTEQILEGDIALCDGFIAGIGEYEGEEETDLQGKIVVPGLIDAHFHIESTMAIPSEVSRVLLEHGVCTLIADPHEIVNAAGTDGLDFMLEDAKKADLDIYFMVPSSVPSCDFEVNGAGTFEADQMKDYASKNEVLGLAEVMRIGDVLNARKDMMDKLDLFSQQTIDGHAPGLAGCTLQAYRAAGIENDHEAGTAKEAIERLQNGFWLLIRQGSGAKNLSALLGGLLENHIPLDRCSFCTDDKHIEDIISEGTIDQTIREAVELGCPVSKAIKMATINTAVHYGLAERGAIAPGYIADLVILNDLDTFAIDSVYKNGRKVQTEQKEEHEPVQVPASLSDSVHLPKLTEADLQIGEEKVWGIEMVPEQLLTKKIRLDLKETSFPSGKYNLLVAAERYGKTGDFAVCPVAGYGIENGAIAMSYAHDSYNVIAAGDSPADVLLAMQKLQEIQGGIVLVENGKVFDALPMEAAGLMSTLPADKIAARVHAMKEKAREMGVSRRTDPFANLSFLSLPVIPEVRLTPQGLYDVLSHSMIGPFHQK